MVLHKGVDEVGHVYLSPLARAALQRVRDQETSLRTELGSLRDASHDYEMKLSRASARNAQLSGELKEANERAQQRAAGERAAVAARQLAEEKLEEALHQRLPKQEGPSAQVWKMPVSLE